MEQEEGILLLDGWVVHMRNTKTMTKKETQRSLCWETGSCDFIHQLLPKGHSQFLPFALELRSTTI